MSKSSTTTRKNRERGKTARMRPAGGWGFLAPTTHPGVILREDFLRGFNLSQHELAMKLRVPATRIGDIVHGRRGMTADTALRLARFFGNSPEFWMTLQQMYDLSKTRVELSQKIEREVEILAYAG